MSKVLHLQARIMKNIFLSPIHDHGLSITLICNFDSSPSLSDGHFQLLLINPLSESAIACGWTGQFQF